MGVVFGGRSGEHEISLRSALSIMSAMDPARYEVVPIGIARDGRWYLYHDALRMLGAAVGESRRAATAPTRGEPAAAARRRPHWSVWHGDPGGRARKEGGALMWSFRSCMGPTAKMARCRVCSNWPAIPYVGAGVLGSAIGMDKDMQKRLLRDARRAGGAVCGARIAATTREIRSRARRLADELGYPVFVKPNALGSSIGSARSSGRRIWPGAGGRFQYDRKLLIEAACEGREFECSVLGNDEPEASLPGEVTVEHGHNFYSYDSKYLDPDGASFKIPAELPEPVTQRIRELSVAAFKALGLRGMTRVDFLASHDLTRIYVGEVNTIPGFTAISMYPKLWEVSGLPLPRLIDRLIDLALEEHRQRASLKVTYHSKTAG